MSKGDDIYLTENQYAVYKENWRDGKLFFRDIEVNPSFVVQAYKQKARVIVEKFPCLRCNTNGTVIVAGKRADCLNCDGTGVDLK